MEIIATHSNTDFDGLAAMVAAKKLYPEAVMVLTHLHDNVEEFVSLHKDALGFLTAREVVKEQIERFILVDTSIRERLGELKDLLLRPGIDIHIYDHHPTCTGDLKGSVQVIENTGAVTTLLVEIIRQKGIPITPFEATIFALGIYEDTGSLLFPNTTARDVAAVAYLLEKGAKLGVVAEFIDRPLSPEQKDLLQKLMESAEVHTFQGVTVLLATAVEEEHVGGVALLTHKLLDIYRTDVALTVVQMGGRVYVVGRNRLDRVDLRRILAPLAGGGHATAASATVKNSTLEEVVQKLLAALEEHIRPAITAGDIMSSPVKTVSPDTTIEEAGRIMLRYGHTGLPVVDENGYVAGIISRRDVDKAIHHGLGHAPVRGYMTRRVICVTPRTSLSEVQRLLIENDIGRLPVMDGGRLVGIVSRTDVLRTLHGGSYPEDYRQLFDTPPGGSEVYNLRDRLSRLPEKIRQLLLQISYTADREKMPVYLVGGVVRDLLLGVPNYDLDIVVEGDAPLLARRFAEELCGRLRTHEKFGTAVVILPDGQRVDFATARTEYYEYPAALPQVERSSLRQDLYRRDFTINAMAICLNSAHFGELVDFFNGRRDLEEGIIRVLYNLSFVEDPTRILRAVRFEQRYGFRIEDQTLGLLKAAVKDGLLGRLSADRLRQELIHILQDSHPWRSVARMRELGIWPAILPEAEITEKTVAEMELCAAVAQELQQLGIETGEEMWLSYLFLLLYPAGEKFSRCLDRLKLPSRWREKLERLKSMLPGILETLTGKEELRPSRLYQLLAPLDSVFYCLLPVLAGEEGRVSVMEGLKKFGQLRGKERPFLNGHDIIAMGYRPGPWIGEALRYLQQARLDGEVTTREEEEKAVRLFLARYFDDEKTGLAQGE